MVPELSQTEEQQASTPVQESAPSETSKDSKTALEHRIAQVFLPILVLIRCRERSKFNTERTHPDMIDT